MKIDLIDRTIHAGARALAEDSAPNWGGKHYDEKPEVPINQLYRERAELVLKAADVAGDQKRTIELQASELKRMDARVAELEAREKLHKHPAWDRVTELEAKLAVAEANLEVARTNAVTADEAIQARQFRVTELETQNINLKFRLDRTAQTLGQTKAELEEATRKQCDCGAKE